jgi:hypothetical protein
MKDRGMLHLCLQKAEGDPTLRLVHRNLKVAMDELGQLLDMLEATLPG